MGQFTCRAVPAPTRAGAHVDQPWILACYWTSTWSRLVPVVRSTATCALLRRRPFASSGTVSSLRDRRGTVLGWLKTIWSGPEKPPPRPAPPAPSPAAPFPPPGPEWLEFTDRLVDAMQRVAAASSDAYFIFQPDPQSDAHVGLLRNNDSPHRWLLSVFGAPMPPEAADLFPLDDLESWNAPSGMTVEETARVASTLLGYLYASPDHVRATFDNGWPLALPAEEAAELLADLTGENAPSLQEPATAGTGRGPVPEPWLIRTPHDAELVAADWIRWFGYSNVCVTPIGPDAGIDVSADEVIVQVKREGVPTGRPVIQNAYGVAAAEGKTAMVFSLGGYVRNAIDWADKVEMPLFQFDLQGVPEPVNPAARAVFEQA